MLNQILRQTPSDPYAVLASMVQGNFLKLAQSSPEIALNSIEPMDTMNSELHT